MPHPRYPGNEIARIGHELYDRSIRSRVENEQNIGKIVSIDIETEEYEVGDDLLVTTKRLLTKHLDAAIRSGRIGYNVVYAVGGTLHRTTE